MQRSNTQTNADLQRAAVVGPRTVSFPPDPPSRENVPTTKTLNSSAKQGLV